ncbi:MAG: hypothetical protein Kow00124_14400 [Anaerolineae bacterium]
MGIGGRTSHAVGRAAVALGAVLIAAVLLPGGTAQAHPADMYAQSITAELAPEGVTLAWTIYPGPLLSPAVWAEADRSADEHVDPAEAEGWVQARLALLEGSLDGEPLTWQVEGVTWPGSLAGLQLGEETIHVTLRAPWPDAASGEHHLRLYNRFEEAISINWYTVIGEAGVRFHTPEQSGGQLAVLLLMPEAGEAAPGDDLRSEWDSGTPALPGTQAASQTQIIPGGLPDTRQSTTILTGLVSAEALTPGFVLGALGIALLLGAIHALTPGHGKTLVAAYLVGSRGTLWHAFTLGGVVTLTHTGSVMALGVVTLAISRFLVPTALFPVLEIASGLLIIIMGAALLIQRWRGWRAVQRSRAAPSQPAPPARVDAPDPTPRRRITIGAPIAVRVYDDVLPETRSLEAIRWRSLVALGISGGLVPCPDAIAILLVALAINRLALGLSMVVAFSTGLAAVLIAIGVAMVRGRRALERMEAFSQVAPALPAISAAIVLGLGIALTAGAFARADFAVLAAGGEALFEEAAGPQAAAAAFQIERASVIYMAPDENERQQVFLLPAAQGGSPIALTAEPPGVRDYALAPDYHTLIYSVPREDGGSDLIAIGTDGQDRRVLLDCGGAACSGPVWSPDGRQVIFERLEMAGPAASQGNTTLWWLDVRSGESGPVFRDAQIPGYSPRWSPDGRWLSYVSPNSSGVQIYNLAEGTSLTIASQMGGPVIWAPGAESLLLLDVRFDEERYITRLLRYDLAEGAAAPLREEPDIEDRTASWSPDGEQIAVVRALLTPGGSSRGDQLWLMRPDGSEARPLTSGEGIIHGTPVWSPDGRYLLYHRYVLAEQWAQPTLVWMDLASGEETVLIKPGYWPAWLP